VRWGLKAGVGIVRQHHLPKRGRERGTDVWGGYMLLSRSNEFASEVFKVKKNWSGKLKIREFESGKGKMIKKSFWGKERGN